MELDRLADPPLAKPNLPEVVPAVGDVGMSHAKRGHTDSRGLKMIAGGLAVILKLVGHSSQVIEAMSNVWVIACRATVRTFVHCHGLEVRQPRRIEITKVVQDDAEVVLSMAHTLRAFTILYRVVAIEGKRMFKLCLGLGETIQARESRAQIGVSVTQLKPT
jgi:hypothetical protein